MGLMEDQALAQPKTTADDREAENPEDHSRFEEQQLKWLAEISEARHCLF